MMTSLTNLTTTITTTTETRSLWGLEQITVKFLVKAAPLSPGIQSALTKLASSLCAICERLCQDNVKIVKELNYSGFQGTGELEHHASLSSLRESVNGGCPVCKELEKSFEERFNMKSDDSWYITCRLKTEMYFYATTGTGLCFQFTFHHSHGHPANPNDGPNLDRDISMSFFPAKALRLGPEYSEYTAGATNVMSIPNISLAQHWLNIYLDNYNYRDRGQLRFLLT
ncbi:hypothetical protein F5883DRAFT_94844 [Diaporthe sp. PMI_573]|nr:hypothetical protein F5883DRAFT_94844 [Diaporthaceae sp. PMI_573]